MCNSDPLALTMDNSFIDLAESKYISLLFSNTEAMDATLVRTSIDRLTSSIPDNKRYLIVENDRASVYMNGSVKKETYDNWDIYDGVILSFSDASTVRNRINDLVKRISQVRMGGRIIIAPETYMNMPCSVESVEVIMTLMRVIPELPDAKSNGVIVGTRS